MYRALHQQPHLNQRSRDEMNGDKDVQVDEVLYGQTGSVPKRKKVYTKESLLREMEETIRYLDVDVLVARTEADKLLGQMRETVGHLSGMRYGKFARTSGAENVIEAEVVKGLKGLEDVINGNSV